MPVTLVGTYLLPCKALMKKEFDYSPDAGDWTYEVEPNGGNNGGSQKNDIPLDQLDFDGFVALPPQKENHVSSIINCKNNGNGLLCKGSPLSCVLMERLYHEQALDSLPPVEEIRHLGKKVDIYLENGGVITLDFKGKMGGRKGVAVSAIVNEPSDSSENKKNTVIELELGSEEPVQRSEYTPTATALKEILKDIGTPLKDSDIETIRF